MKKITLIFLFITCKIAIAQSYELINNDTVNTIDVTGKKQGKWIITNIMVHKPCYADDQKVEEGKFADSKKVGFWKEYYCNKALKSKITYENGRPSGYAILYHDNGKVKEEGLWKNNRWVGDYKLYFSNGQVQQAFMFNTSGKREGAQQYFFENGQLMIDGVWADGKESGTLKEYYENGDLRSEKTFNGGNIDPSSIKNYDPKKPLVEKPVDILIEAPAPPVVAKKDEKDNLGKVFTGEGYWKLYNANKQVSKDGEFSKSRLMDGKVYFYSADGILTRIAVYKGGRYIGDSVIEED
jgi:antitoxin component YwqK of YwqJK toxin-antitoxin module